jgi:hypothetical protein
MSSASSSFAGVAQIQIGHREADGTGHTGNDTKGNQQPHHHPFRLGLRSPCHSQPPNGRLTPYPVPGVRAEVLGNLPRDWLPPRPIATTDRRILATNVAKRFLLSGTRPLPTQSTKSSAEDGRTGFRWRDPDQAAALFDHGGAIVVPVRMLSGDGAAERRACTSSCDGSTGRGRGNVKVSNELD